VHVFPSFGFGGVPIRIADVINKLAPGFRHTILALDGCYDSGRRLVPNACVQFGEPPGLPAGLIGSVAYAVRQLRRLGPDLLATYNWGSIEWALANTMLARFPHVHFESGFGPEEAERQIPRRVYTRRVALTGASRLVVPSRSLEKIAVDTWRIRRRKIDYVPNGVDLDRFTSAPVLGDLAGFVKQPGELVVGTVAPLRREKNIERLIRAFAAVRSRVATVRLLVVGDGAERARLEALAGALGIADKVVFAGHVDRVEQVFGWIDVFAMSSDTEQMPNSLIQAMATGRAVAAVDVGDIGIIVDKLNGPFIVPRDDPAAFVAALTNLLDDVALRERVGSANQARARRVYGLDAMVARYRAIFEGEF
jgi:glycosyltransferase involved in cell wall biosynthesis